MPWRISHDRGGPLVGYELTSRADQGPHQPGTRTGEGGQRRDDGHRGTGGGRVPPLDVDQLVGQDSLQLDQAQALVEA